jgi:mannitol/fructose-specific phosphotransferase system IIA component (Ntr-type)
MSLLELLDENVIKIGMESLDKDEAIAELAELLVRAERVSDRGGVLEAVYARERKGTTGIGGGVAVPHAKHESIKQLTAALGTSSEGIEFDAVDDEPVHVVFLVLADPDQAGPHVACLADIANLLQVPGVYEKLKNASSPEALRDVIREAMEAE